MVDDSGGPMDGLAPYPSYINGPRLDQAIVRIAQAVRDARVEFLFGAGMSKDSKVPPGRELAEKLLAHYFPGAAGHQPSPERLKKLAEKYPLEAIATAIEAMPGKGRTDLTEKLEAALFDELEPDLSAHDLFLSLCYWDGDDGPKVRRIFTTNYDRLLEDAFGDKGVSVTEDTYEAIRQKQQHRPPHIPIFHLHGALDGDYRITEDDVFSGGHSRFRTVFQTALEEADAFVLVGYALNDPDFRRVYMEYREAIRARDPGGGKDDKTTYVVSPPDDEFDYQIGAVIWKARGAIWIPLDAFSFFKRLRLFLEYGSGEKRQSGS